MSAKKNGSKITLGMLKGKPVTTSVPTIAIRFNAGAEEVEEVYGSDNEAADQVEITAATTSATANTVSTGSGDSESSPLRSYLRIGKRSTSIDVSPSTTTQDASPSDPWRFFSDIKGKITKSVEGKLTEYKTKKENEGEGSPQKTKSTKETNSDSEDTSESSISKTCGIISTTDEMSTDDETPSVSDKEKKPDKAVVENKLRRRFRSTKSNLAVDNSSPPTPASEEDDGAIESGIEALEAIIEQAESTPGLVEKLNAEPKTAKKSIEFDSFTYASSGYMPAKPRKQISLFQVLYTFKYVFLLAMCLFIYFGMKFPVYACGFVAGSMVTFCICTIYIMVFIPVDRPRYDNTEEETNYFEIEAAKEIQPEIKYEGWVNEFPDVYNPHTYHISQTQSVYLKLQGNMLRVSNTKSKIPKRAVWNEPERTVELTYHRIYNLLGANISILPDGLARTKRWSKKYPICVKLDPEQVHVQHVKKESVELHETKSKVGEKSEHKVGFKKYVTKSQLLAKLKDDYEMNDEEGETVNGELITEELLPDMEDEDEEEEEEVAIEDDTLEETMSFFDDWASYTPDDSPTKIKLYFFGRTDRDKELWFRRFAAATHKGAQLTKKELATDPSESVSDTLINDAMEESEYVKYMYSFKKVHPYRESHLLASSFHSKMWRSRMRLFSDMDKDIKPNVFWVNALVGRLLYDCMRNPVFTDLVKQRIQKKLSAIKLPYFINELIVTELNLGTEAPFIHKASTPIIDDRGLWIDLDITYEGLVILILQTNLNLLKLKQPPNSQIGVDEKDLKGEKSLAMFNSDIDDSAESSTDDDLTDSTVLDSHGLPVYGLGGTSNASKKFIKIVDKMTESRIFQVATENKYIKKAMESVSNTELRLKVEVQTLVGTLVLNIPPPPSDRVWISFRPIPKLQLTALPIVGERNITFIRATSWIERKLLDEFQKLLVLPNMEDITVPIMCSKLPA